MRRREFVVILGCAAAWPFAGFAQERGRTYRLGSLHAAPRDAPHHIAFFEELRRFVGVSDDVAAGQLAPLTTNQLPAPGSSPGCPGSSP